MILEKKPGMVVVTDVSNERIRRARQFIPEEMAARHGIKLVYVNPDECQDQLADLLALTGGKGYDDIFVYAPIRPLAEMADKLLGFDGCLNFFAGPSNKDLSAEINLYNCHYTSTHIMGTTGGNTDDLKESIRLAAEGKIRPSVRQAGRLLRRPRRTVERRGGKDSV